MSSESKEQAQESVRPRTRRFLLPSVAALVLLCFLLVGIGVANGWSLESDLLRTTDESSTSSLSARNNVLPATKPEVVGPSVGAFLHQREPGEVVNQQPDASASNSSNSESSAPVSPVTQSGSEEVSTPVYITVSVYVDSSNAASLGYPACMASTSVTLYPGASVYDALCATGVAVGGSSDYVRSIGGLSEFQGGPTSGWLYYVNGAYPGYSCGSYLLYGGESIYWTYSLEL